MPLFAHARIVKQPGNPNILYCASPAEPFNPDSRANRLTAIAVLLLNIHFEHTPQTRAKFRGQLANILHESTRGRDKSGGANAANALHEMRSPEIYDAVEGFAIASLLMNDPESPKLHIAYGGTGGVYVGRTSAKNTIITPGFYQPTGLDVYCMPQSNGGMVSQPQPDYDEYIFKFNSPKVANYRHGGIRVVVGHETTLSQVRGMGGTGINTIFPFMTVVEQKEASILPR